MIPAENSLLWRRPVLGRKGAGATFASGEKRLRGRMQGDQIEVKQNKMVDRNWRHKKIHLCGMRSWV